MTNMDLIAEARRSAPFSEDESLLMRLANALEVAKSQAWDEGRASVALDFLGPTDEVGMRKSSTNPYRTDPTR